MQDNWVEEEFRKLQEQANSMEQSAENMYSVGTSFYQLHTSEATEHAVQLWLKASELNHGQAMATLGNYYITYEEDVERASHWLTKAADLGDASAANTLIFSILIPQKEWDLIDHYVKLAVASNTEGQSTNALSNGAIAKYLRGNVEESIEAFKEALLREDHFADSEASWWLAMIYNELGDEVNERKYASICFESGGFRMSELANKYHDIMPGETKLRNHRLSAELSESLENLLILWEKEVDSGSSEDLEDDVFLAVNYAELALRGHASLNESGQNKVKEAIDVLSSRQ